MLLAPRTPASPDIGQSDLRIAYVVKRFPRFSETFVVNEILAHESMGVAIEVFSLRPPSDTHFQDQIARVLAPTNYLSCGRVKAEEIWRSLSVAHHEFALTADALDCLVEAHPLDAYCGLQLASDVRKKCISHIHAHFASSAATVARIASKITGVPYTITAHAKDIFHEAVDETDLRKKLADAKATFTVSDFNLRFLKARFGKFADGVVRIYNGLSLDEFPFSSPENRPTRIIAVGRLVEKKGFADLVSACEILRNRGHLFECLILGGGELQGELLAQIEACRLSNCVQLLGSVPQHRVKALVQGSAVLVAPCIEGRDGNRDGLPTVLLEAMALGTPCISTAVTGIPELVRHEQTGMIVDQHAPQQLANAIAELLTNRELRCRLAQGARLVMEREFDIRLNTQAQREKMVHPHSRLFQSASSTDSELPVPTNVEMRS